MERPEKKVQIKRIPSPHDGSCDGCMFMAGWECVLPTSADVQFDVEIGENDTLPPYRCYDKTIGQHYIYIEKKGGAR